MPPASSLQPHAAARHARRWALVATLAAGALCAGCGSSHHSSSTASTAAQASKGLLAARAPFKLTVEGDNFQVALVDSRITGASPDGDAAPAGHGWLEAELKVTSLQKSGLADLGWLENSIHIYANGSAAGENCADASLFAGLCLLNVTDVDNSGSKPGVTFLDTSLRPRQSQLVWAYTSDTERSATAHDVAVTLAPLVAGMTFDAPIVKSPDAPSGQVVLNTGGPQLKPGTPGE